MRLDYHMHTRLCKHAVGEPVDYARAAIAAGLDEIGFSDHNPMPEGYDPDFRMRPEEMGTYAQWVEAARAAFPRLPIKFGLEADFHPGTEEYVQDTLESWPFDYVIGSVHYIGTWGFDNPDLQGEFAKRDLWEVYTQYFTLVERMAEAGMFDIAGHFDLVKKFGHYPERDWMPPARRALEAVKAQGMCLEVNTAGWRKPVGDLYPATRVLEEAARMGIPVTLGSDAHEARHVGADFDRAAGILAKAGYRSISRFTRREREETPL
jgi:histidinol-phosphatase (PHP family)